MKIKVTTHSGDEDIIEMESYNPQDITKLRNDHEILAIQLGDYSYSRIDIKNIKPIQD